MKKYFAMTGLLVLAGCAQYTTSDEERETMRVASEREAEAYIQCVKQESQRLLSISSEASFIADTAKDACATQLNAFTAAESELLDSQYMMIDTQLENSIEKLNERSKIAVAEVLTAGIAAGPAATASSTGPAQAAASQPQQRPVTGNFTPEFEQRVYLDCMQDQAKKYVRLSETAAAIADVAASRCRTHLVGTNQAALEQEGRAQVMGTVFDARLEARP